jgi:hypothetical protein
MVNNNWKKKKLQLLWKKDLKDKKEEVVVKEEGEKEEEEEIDLIEGIEVEDEEEVIMLKDHGAKMPKDSLLSRMKMSPLIEEEVDEAEDLIVVGEAIEVVIEVVKEEDTEEEVREEIEVEVKDHRERDKNLLRENRLMKRTKQEVKLLKVKQSNECHRDD